MRAGIELVIGHLKSNHRMIRNILKGTRGNDIKTLTVYNMTHCMNLNSFSYFGSWLKTMVEDLENVIFGNIIQRSFHNLVFRNSIVVFSRLDKSICDYAFH